MNYAELEKKIKSMTAHDIIMAMVEGLRQPRTVIDMDDFGYIKDSICYGCAATNAILHIMEAGDEEAVDHVHGRASFAYGTLEKFELAIDQLRKGRVHLYNYYAELYDLAKIVPMPGLELPPLRNNYMSRYKGKQLNEYVKLAEYQLTVNQ